MTNGDTGAIHDKVVAATLGAAASQVVVYVIEAAAKIDIPAAIEGAITTIMVFALGYFVKERKPATA